MTEERRTFDPVDGTDAEMFIQWKNTDLCIDFKCPCGGGGHYDGYFAYYICCPACETVYEMGTQVRATKVDENSDEADAKFLDDASEAHAEWVADKAEAPFRVRFRISDNPVAKVLQKGPVAIDVGYRDDVVSVDAKDVKWWTVNTDPKPVRPS
jgi:hypothetical protein